MIFARILKGIWDSLQTMGCGIVIPTFQGPSNVEAFIRKINCFYLSVCLEDSRVKRDTEEIIRPPGRTVVIIELRPGQLVLGLLLTFSEIE